MKQESAATWEDPASLTPWEENPRRNDHVVDRVARSIQRFGFAAPIVARLADRKIVAGHTRWKAANRLSLARVPVRFMDLSEDEAAALALADNRLGELAEWNDVDVAKILHDLKGEDVDIGDLGWTPSELDGLLDQLTEVSSHTRGPTTPDPEPLAPRPIPGGVTLRAGDCWQQLPNLGDNSIDALVTDPPYGLSRPPTAPELADILTAWISGEQVEHDRPGFMGATWDSFVPGPHVWREVFRVLKPGAHGVVFAGTRTVDLMGIALRLAGFEVRDCGVWTYWTGYCKSVNLSKALDRQKGDRDEVLKICAWVRDARDAAGKTNAEIDAVFGLNGMAGHWTTQGSQPAVPTAEQWPELLQFLEAEPPPEIAELADTLIRSKGQPGAEWFKRQATGVRMADDTAETAVGLPNQQRHHRKITETEPATEEARRWLGWGTGIKPAHEPWLLIRKPVERSDMSVADNLRKWGVGGLNLKGCSFPAGDPMWPGVPEDDGRGPRLPANLVHVKKPHRREKDAGCEALPAKTGAEAVGRKAGSAGVRNPRAGAGRTATEVRNYHPTVKPLRLMAWLSRLVCPPGGKILDPFMGSGSTGAAAVPQGFDFVGFDLEPGHVDIAGQRIAYWADHGLEEVIGSDSGVDDPDEQGG